METTILTVKINRRWFFVVPSTLHPGTMTKSVRSFDSERAALAAGRKEFKS